MEFHKELIEGLRQKHFDVGNVYEQAGPDGFTAHQFIRVAGIGMPIEVARDLNRGLVTLSEIEANVHRFSN